MKRKDKLTPDQAKLVEGHIALAHKIVNSHRQYDAPGRASKEDLVSEAYLGLVEAAMTWEPALGPFLPYAKKVVKNKLIIADRNSRGQVKLSTNSHIILRNMRRAANDGTPETPQAIAAALNINLAKITELWQYYMNTYSVALDEPTDDNPYAEQVPSDVSTEETVEQAVIQEDVRKVVDGLPPRLRRLIRYRFGFETGIPMLASEVATKMSVNKAEYAKLEEAAMAALNQRLARYTDPDGK